MNDVRGWIERKLAESRFSATRLSDRQLEITRDNLPNARVLCVGLAKGETFGVENLDAALADVPGTGFIVVVPTAITHAAYERAEELGVCVAGFGELVSALHHDPDVAQHIDSQEQYERRRLIRNEAVTSIKRKGYHAYEIQRRKLRSLTVVTTNDYEFTADRLYSILESHDGINPDLIIVTNPNCRGFSTDSRKAAARAGIPLVHFEDFLDGLGSKWA
ncbi:hypothetical protein [Streptomyces sp. WM6378]|uniref:hypothetical protein n=1 Tax=Streptomyces sp. WM6378 TaxID=1415557 RepID=UPI000B321A24|nr:hypothetical protein [Streptomyces sp. WM6378]